MGSSGRTAAEDPLAFADRRVAVVTDESCAFGFLPSRGLHANAPAGPLAVLGPSSRATIRRAGSSLPAPFRRQNRRGSRARMHAELRPTRRARRWCHTGGGGRHPLDGPPTGVTASSAHFGTSSVSWRDRGMRHHGTTPHVSSSLRASGPRGARRTLTSARLAKTAPEDAAHAGARRRTPQPPRAELDGTKAKGPHPFECGLSAGSSDLLRGWVFLKKTRQRPTLPPTRVGSTIGSEKLNFRVRYGIGCGLLDIATGNLG